MKRIFCVLILFGILKTVAQERKGFDIIVKKDFAIIEGNVVKIGDNVVEFTYVNEQHINSFDLNSVAKIYFASGRVEEFFDKQASTENLGVTENNKPPLLFREIRKNSLAVLPVSFFNSETNIVSDEKSKYGQKDVYLEISKHSNHYKLQDLRETNSLLKLAGFNLDNIDIVPIETLQKVLGVEHIVSAKVSYSLSKTQSISNDSYSEIRAGRNRNRIQGIDFSNTSITDETNYEYKIYLDIYRNSEKIYSQTRIPNFVFGGGKDSWLNSIRYLIKRSPLYEKK